MAIPPVPDSDEALFLARRRRRSVALGLVLGALVILFYVLTFVKMAAQHGVPSL